MQDHYEESDSESLIERNGQIVFTLSWDGGGIGMNGTNRVFKFQEKYWASIEAFEDILGPFDTLDAALDQGFLSITSATESIWCPEMDNEAIARGLELIDDEDPVSIEINGEMWTVLPEGGAVRSRVN